MQKSMSRLFSATPWKRCTRRQIASLQEMRRISVSFLPCGFVSGFSAFRLFVFLPFLGPFRGVQGNYRINYDFR